MNKKSTRSMRKFAVARLSLAVSFACVAMAAQAQSNESSSDAEKARKAQQHVEVSGRFGDDSASIKSNVSLRDVPISVSVVKGDVLQEQGALSLDAAIKNVSGLTQSSTNNYGYFNNYLARGLPVNFLRDGMPDGPAVNGYMRSLSDVSQIEVVKGPGSAMYGSGAPGGFVNLVSKKAERESSQSVELGIASFQGRNAKFEATGSLATSANESSANLYRVTAAYQNADGYRGYGSRSTEVIPHLVFQTGVGQSMSVELRHLDSTVHNDSVGMPFRNRQILDVPQEFRFYTPFARSATRIDRVNLKHSAQLDREWTLESVVSHGRRDLDFLRNVPSWRLNDPITGTQIVNRTWRDQQDRLHDSALQVEAKWRTAIGLSFHEFLFGGAWNRTEGTASRRQALLAPIGNIFTPTFPEQSNAELDRVLAWNRQVNNQQAGLYVQDQIALSPEWKIRAAIRYDRYQIEDSGDYNTLFDAGGAFLSTLAPNKQSYQSKAPVMRYESAQVSSGKWNPAAGLVYQVSQSTSVYGGASAGAFSNFTTEMGRTAFAPERSRQIELGLKTLAIDGLWSSNLALYDTRRNDFFQTANGLTGTLGSSKTRGVDAEFVVRPSQAWKLRFSYAYQDAVHTKYVNVVTKKDDVNVLGKQVPGTSKNQFSLWTTYDFQAEQLQRFGIGAGLNYRDDFYADALNTNRAPGKTVVDMVAYFRQKQFEVQTNISNLTNQRWYRYATGDGAVAPGDARSISVTARFYF